MTASDALVGYTGFVGGIINSQHHFDALYDAQNIEEIAGKKFGLLVCAGAPGVKWLANKEPKEDLASIERLMNALDHVQADAMVLISTVDVYAHPAGVTEKTPID